MSESDSMEIHSVFRITVIVLIGRKFLGICQKNLDGTLVSAAHATFFFSIFFYFFSRLQSHFAASFVCRFSCLLTIPCLFPFFFWSLPMAPMACRSMICTLRFNSWCERMIMIGWRNGREWERNLSSDYLRGAWSDRDTNDIFAHCSFIFYFLDLKFSNFVCPSELHPLIWFFLKNSFRKKKNIRKTSQNALAPSIFIVWSIVLKLGTTASTHPSAKYVVTKFLISL